MKSCFYLPNSLKLILQYYIILYYSWTTTCKRGHFKGPFGIFLVFFSGFSRIFLWFIRFFLWIYYFFAEFFWRDFFNIFSIFSIVLEICSRNCFSKQGFFPFILKFFFGFYREILWLYFFWISSVIFKQQGNSIIHIVL